MPQTAIDLHTLAIDIHSLLATSGGCTLDINEGTQPTEGFAVSVPGAEQQFKHPPTIAQIRSWLSRTANPLAATLEAQGKAPHIGAWVDEHGVTYLDVSVVIHNEDDAVASGRQWKQRAIFDLATAATLTFA